VITINKRKKRGDYQLNKAKRGEDKGAKINDQTAGGILYWLGKRMKQRKNGGVVDREWKKKRPKEIPSNQ